MSGIAWLQKTDLPEALPDTARALKEPNGLLAVGGALTPEWLIHAYRHGVFPWYSVEQPILWWAPDPRAVLLPEDFHLSRSLRRSIRKRGYVVRLDTAFEDVIAACAEPRHGSGGTWITRAMHEAYVTLHRRGLAHSFETWHGNRLVGGLYGVAMGRMFYGESMFSRATDASKVALVALVDELRRRGFPLIDCQVRTPLLAQLGGREIPRREFLRRLRALVNYSEPGGRWTRVPAQ